MCALLNFEAEMLPGLMVWDKPLSDHEFEALCLANDNIRFERTKDGQVRVNPPTGLYTSDGNSEVIAHLRNWWKTHRRGRVFESNAGFFLHDGSMLIPDAAYVLPQTLKGLTRREMERLARLCPDFVVELLSITDRLREAQEKMLSWIANGASLAWLIDPYARTVFVYRPGMRVESVTGNSIEGVGPAAGFVLDLSEVWRCYD